MNPQRFTLLVVATLLLLPMTRQTRAQDAKLSNGLNPVSFFLGEWDIRVRDGQGNLMGRARTEVDTILDGTILKADYFALGPGGETVFRGTTLRTPVSGSNRFVVHWAMAGIPGYTYLDEQLIDGELRAEGHGIDGRGEFLERYRYYNLSDTTYAFRMSRSYDAGETWNEEVRLEARRPDGYSN